MWLFGKDGFTESYKSYNAAYVDLANKTVRNRKLVAPVWIHEYECEDVRRKCHDGVYNHTAKLEEPHWVFDSQTDKMELVE